jgi:hypothetical protein
MVTPDELALKGAGRLPVRAGLAGTIFIPNWSGLPRRKARAWPM